MFVNRKSLKFQYYRNLFGIVENLSFTHALLANLVSDVSVQFDVFNSGIFPR